MSKITIEKIKGEAQENGWLLLSSDYKNLKSELQLRCPNQHNVTTTYEKWRRNHECPVCALSQKEQIAEQIVFPKKKDSYRILALDQATKVSGWSVFEDGELIKSGTFITSGTNEVQRIDEVKKWLWNMISVYQIDFVEFEDIQLQDHKEEGGNGEKIGVTVYKVLAHLQGVLINLCYSNGIPFEVAHVATWRSFNNIKGRNKSDKKKSAQLQAQAIYNKKFDIDEAEAVCIGRYAAAGHGKQQELISWE